MNEQTIDATARLLETGLWWVAAAIGTWFVLGALACGVSRVAPHVRAVRVAVRWSPAIVRRLAGTAAGASMLLSSPALAYATDEIAPIPAVIDDEPLVRTPATTAAPAPVAPVAPVAPDAAARTHVVAPGDNLWQIARAELGPDAPAAAAAQYWRSLVDTNRATLRSGDPSLIYPGEAITLPPTSPG